jgi:membrane-associated phospholipid phosphatase
MIGRCVTCICLLAVVSMARGQQPDSLNVSQPEVVIDTLIDSNAEKKSFWQSKVVRISTVPVLFFTASAATWGSREEIREFRNRYIPTFRHHYDDYLQYTPALTVFGLNAFGVKGKHKIGRTFVSYLFSVAISVGVVTAVKSIAHVERPSGEHEMNSFPSGHTTNAFMNATFLHKEYGQYRSPLYSVAGYTVATATGISRELNNRHWISDVLAGAGIGILSTEVAYLITDKIYKERGMNEPIHRNTVPINGKPSFLQMNFGYANAIEDDLTTGDDKLTAKRGINFGIEGAWFFHKNFGLGAEFAFSSFPINADNYLVNDPDVHEFIEGFYSQPMGIRYLHAGPYFSVPLPRNWFITGKIGAGTAMGARGEIVAYLTEEFQELGIEELPLLRYLPELAFSWNAGVGIQKRITRNVAINAYTRYFHSVHDFELEVVDNVNENMEFTYVKVSTTKVDFSHMTYGLGLTAYLW